MSDLTLRNVPDDLRRRLADAAARNRTSPSREALRVLDRWLGSDDAQPVGLASAPENAGETAEARLDELHRQMREAGVWLTLDDIQLAIDQGRP